MLNPWFDLTFKTVQLGIVAQNVRMVIEKATAAGEAHLAAVGAAIAGRKDHVIAGKATQRHYKARRC